MPYICVRGVEHYYEWIKAENGASVKPVMVFVHGWAGSARYWESTAKALVNDFDCLLYDMRGFGRSSGRSPLAQATIAVADATAPAQQAEAVEELTYELDEYARDLAALLDALKIERIYLNAHSTGASVATLFLNLYPERVEKAILTCSGVFEYDEKAFSAFHKFGGYVVKFRPEAIDRIKRSLALQEVAKRESLQAEPATVDERVKELLTQYKDQEIDRERLREVVTEEVLTEKILDWLQANATVESATASST
jgi:pimeloyl-ACP methyl ester carboxylesterase